MNVLDENIPRDQADLLRQGGVRFRSISRALGYQGIADERFLGHPFFRTSAQRLGKMVRVRPSGIEYWTKNATGLAHVEWL